MNLQQHHGLMLAEGASLYNLRIENINDVDGVPDNISTPGRIWYNATLNCLQFTVMQNNVLSVATILTSVSQQVAGWKDLIGDLSVAKTGSSNAPLWMDTGNGFYAYRFDNAKDVGLQIQFHSTHDIDYTKKVFPHIHWCPTSTNIGNVYFKLNILICKGHEQGSNLLNTTVQTIYITGTTKGIIGEHIVSECSAADALIIPEPDCMIMVYLYRLGTHANDTYTGNVYGYNLDLHYWSVQDTTPGKNPNFSSLDAPTSV